MSDWTCGVCGEGNMQDDSVCKGDQHSEALVQHEVQITAADYNGSSWDGSPFSSLPKWLQEAVEQGIVSIEPSNTDYALWRVVTVVGPGDQIVRSSLASASDGDGMRKALECCLEQLVAYEENGWLGEGWRTRVGLRSDIDRARAALK